MESIGPEGENSGQAAEPKAEAERPLTATRVETHRVSHPLWRWLVGILAILVVAFLLILLARWIYHATHHHSKPVSSTSQKAPVAPSQSKNSASQKSTSNSSSSSPNPSSSGGNSQITNTGPGDTTAIFVGVSAIAGGAHYIVRRRRAKLM